MWLAAACGRGTTAKSLFGLTSWRCLRRAASSPHGGVLARMSEIPLSYSPSKSSVFLPCGGLRGGEGMVSRSWPSVVPVREGCPGAASGCPSGTLHGEGSCCGYIDGTRWWAGGHRTPEGRKPLSFLRPLPRRLRRAPAVVVRPPRLGGLAASQSGWGAPSRIGPVGRVAGARVQGWCCHSQLAGGVAFRGS